MHNQNPFKGLIRASYLLRSAPSGAATLRRETEDAIESTERLFGAVLTMAFKATLIIEQIQPLNHPFAELTTEATRINSELTALTKRIYGHAAKLRLNAASMTPAIQMLQLYILTTYVETKLSELECGIERMHLDAIQVSTNQQTNKRSIDIRDAEELIDNLHRLASCTSGLSKNSEQACLTATKTLARCACGSRMRPKNKHHQLKIK